MKLFVGILTLFYAQLSWALSADLQAQFSRALEYEQAGQLARANKTLAQLYQQQPQDFSLSLAYGRVLTRAQQAQRAIEVLRPWAKADNANWQLWFFLGSAHLISGNLAEAEFFLDEALAREGEQFSVWLNRAIVAQAQDNPQASLYMLQVAANQAPSHPALLLNRAYAHESLNHWDKALDNYRAFLQASSSQPQYARVRSQVLLRLSKAGAALQQHRTNSSKPD